MFADARIPVIPVVEGGVLVGVLSQTDIAAGLQLSELEATQHPSAPPHA